MSPDLADEHQSLPCATQKARVYAAHRQAFVYPLAYHMAYWGTGSVGPRAQGQ